MKKIKEFKKKRRKEWGKKGEKGKLQGQEEGAN